jgi:uncharacterized protein (UPF0335 family)
LAVVTAADEEKEAAIARLNAEVARLSAALAATTERLERTEEEKHNVRERLKEEEVKHHLESVNVARAAEALKEADAKADALQRTFAALKVSPSLDPSKINASLTPSSSFPLVGGGNDRGRPGKRDQDVLGHPSRAKPRVGGAAGTGVEPVETGKRGRRGGDGEVHQDAQHVRDLGGAAHARHDRGACDKERVHGHGSSASR